MWAILVQGRVMWQETAEQSFQRTRAEHFESFHNKEMMTHLFNEMDSDLTEATVT